MNIKRIAKILEEKNENLINEVVLTKAQKGNQIVYGARAINRQLPTYLNKDTSDYDILTKNPKKSAQEIALELNRRLGREEFSVSKAKHLGTYKVKDSKGETIVDYTQLKRMPKVKESWGNKFYDIKSIKHNINKRLRDKSKEFRWEKDKEALNRIKLSEETFNF